MAGAEAIDGPRRARGAGLVGRRASRSPRRPPSAGSPIARSPGSEHDDANVPALPEANHLQDLEVTVTIRDSVANEADRILAAEGPVPPEDVNAADEVPCSTWFCARNHLRPMSLEEIVGRAAGRRARSAVQDHEGQGPGLGHRLPGGGREGAHLHAQARPRRPPRPHDRGRDDREPAVPRRRLQRPRARSSSSSIGPTCSVDPRATFKLYKVEKRPLTEARVASQLAGVARLPDGRIRAVAIPWIPGKILGAFDTIGRRPERPERSHPPRAPAVAARELGAVRVALDPRPRPDQHDRQLRRGGRAALRPTLPLRLQLRVRLGDLVRAGAAAGRRVPDRDRPDAARAVLARAVRAAVPGAGRSATSGRS